MVLLSRSDCIQRLSCSLVCVVHIFVYIDFASDVKICAFFGRGVSLYRWDRRSASSLRSDCVWCRDRISRLTSSHLEINKVTELTSLATGLYVIGFLCTFAVTVGRIVL